MSHARTAFKCQVTTAESLAVSVMQEPADIWECRVAKGSREKEAKGWGRVGRGGTSLWWEREKARWQRGGVGGGGRGGVGGGGGGGGGEWGG